MCNQWIAVSDELPKALGFGASAQVLVGATDLTDIRIAVYYHATEMVNAKWISRGSVLSGITHWQPLPLPPEGD